MEQAQSAEGSFGFSAVLGGLRFLICIRILSAYLFICSIVYCNTDRSGAIPDPQLVYTRFKSPYACQNWMRLVVMPFNPLFNTPSVVIRLGIYDEELVSN